MTLRQKDINFHFFENKIIFKNHNYDIILKINNLTLNYDTSSKDINFHLKKIKKFITR